jgi:hypothetical protein
MIKAISIYFARRAYAKALDARRTYDSWNRGANWDITISAALHRAECDAANNLARLIHPAAILRAF